MTLDTASGDYEAEFRNLENPGEGLDAGEVLPALNAVVAQLAGRCTEQQARASRRGDDEIELVGDDHTIN